MSDDKKVFIYDGEKTDVSWDGRLCIHIGECGQAKGDLFVGGRQPWCQPDQVDSAQDIDEVIKRCPSGAIAYRCKDKSTQEHAEQENTVLVSPNGPLYVRGDLDIDGALDDMPGVRYRAALCRCGLSSNKPFCDNAHEAAGFKDSGAVGDIGTGFDNPGGKLTVKRAENGPLILTGNFSIIASSGRSTWKGTETALCRCGQSRNKPFCDGSHVAANFKAD